MTNEKESRPRASKPRTPTKPPKAKRLLVKGPYEGSLKVNEVLVFVEIATILKDHRQDGLTVSPTRIAAALGYSRFAFSQLLARLNMRFKTAVTQVPVGSRHLVLTEKGEEIHAVWSLRQPYLAWYYDLRDVDMIPLIKKVEVYFNDLIADAMEPRLSRPRKN